MLTSEREKRICARYSARDEHDRVHCYECPLQKGNFDMWDFRCKANSHYDRSEKDWVYDDETGEATMIEIKVKYFSDKILPLEQKENCDWIDLRSAIDVSIKAGDYMKIPLGVGMILPDGYEALIAPRGSTFENWGIIITNSPGVVDNSFSGDENEWLCSAYALRDTEIKVNDRICQFKIEKKMPKIQITAVEHLNEKNRGCFGSTGRN